MRNALVWTLTIVAAAMFLLAGTLKLIGFDHLRGNIIPMSIDHIRKLTLTDEELVRPANFELRRYLAENCFNGIPGDPVTMRLRAYGDVRHRFLLIRVLKPSKRELACSPRRAKRAVGTSK